MTYEVEKKCSFCDEVTTFVPDESGNLYCSKCGFYEETEEEESKED